MVPSACASSSPPVATAASWSSSLAEPGAHPHPPLWLTADHPLPFVQAGAMRGRSSDDLLHHQPAASPGIGRGGSRSGASAVAVGGGWHFQDWFVTDVDNCDGGEER